MISLCLTKPHTQKIVTDSDDKYVQRHRRSSSIKSICAKQAFSNENVSTIDAVQQKGNNTSNGDDSIDKEKPINSDQSFKSDFSEISLKDKRSDFYKNHSDNFECRTVKTLSSFKDKKSKFLNRVLSQQKSKMIDTLQAMGSRQEKRLSFCRRKRYIRHYSQCMPDARKDDYRVHKWRIKSGRNSNVCNFQERKILRFQRKLQSLKDYEKKFVFQSKSMSSLHYKNVEPRYLSNAASSDAMLKNKEQLFGASSSEIQMHQGKKPKRSIVLLPNLQNFIHDNENLSVLLSVDNEEEAIRNLSTVYARHRSLGTNFNLQVKASNKQITNQQLKITSNPSSSRRNSETAIHPKGILPPIVNHDRRRSLPEHHLKEHDLRYSNKSYFKRRISLKPVGSPITIPENEILHPTFIGRKTLTKELQSRITPETLSEKEPIVQKVIYNGSPLRKLSQTPLIMHPTNLYRSSSKEGKDGDTPTDSEGSFGHSRKQRTRMTRGRMLTKMDSRISPQSFRYIKPSRMATLMRQWYICAKLAIWLARLFKGHRVFVDDSYNIQNGSNAVEGGVGKGIKKEVLFDVTDYKMKNQLRLSETTRKVLLTPSEKRTEKELNLVQTALRNIKAISDYSNTVQKQIGKYGYFVAFEGKRVVVKEKKRPLNYYLLLAGSAVVIKSDESGNTNPVLFMKRGAVFGEKEILDDTKWQWSVATSGYCEFLLLDRNDYKNIFITGGGGGLLSDPERGGFLRSIELLQQWPIQLLEENPNRCLFRYFKRGAVLVNDSKNSEWIYIIKSGSCSVLKHIQVESLTDDEILHRLQLNQKFQSSYSDDPRLVEKSEKINEKEHIDLLLEKAEKEQAKEVSVYQQLEMSSILKELNPEIIGTTLTPRAEAGFEDRRSEFPLSSYKATIGNDLTNLKIKQEENELKGTIQHNPSPPYNEDGLWFSRHFDHHPPRTPSPIKAAYLRTGVSTSSSNRNECKSSEIFFKTNVDQPPKIVVTDIQQPEEPHKKLVSAQKQVHINEFLFGSDSPVDITDEQAGENTLLSVHVNVRRLTKRDMFGIEADLYSGQPSLALVSNGAECLMLNKKFYLENSTEESMNFLKEVGYPYPSEEELQEQHWRLMTWRAYQAKVVKHLNEEKSY